MRVTAESLRTFRLFRGAPARGVDDLALACRASTLRAGARVIRGRVAGGRGELRRLAETDADVLRGVHDALLEHTRVLRAKIDVMTAADVEQRLARLVVHLLARFGDDLDDGSAVLPLDLQRRQLADLVGARVETVIRTLRRWPARGLVTSGKGRLCVADPRALAAIASSHER